jgi:hypothetical protein
MTSWMILICCSDFAVVRCQLNGSMGRSGDSIRLPFHNSLVLGRTANGCVFSFVHRECWFGALQLNL